MKTKQLIAELKKRLDAEVYAKLRKDFDDLAWLIAIESIDHDTGHENTQDYPI